MNEKYSGMTMNERLFASGMMEVFEQAFEAKDINKIAELYTALTSCEKEEAIRNAKMILSRT
jgi:hypothetical protein